MEHPRHRSGAADHQGRALALARASDERYRQAVVLVGLAATRHTLGDPDQAREHAGSALAIAREDGYRIVTEQARAVLDLLDLSDD